MTTTDSPEPDLSLTGDAPKRSVEEDEFGLAEIAHAIARVVRDRVSANGYAIGLEGPWGSGKTTLLNFIEQLLRQKSNVNQKVIRFDPWLIGSKQALLSTFFEELAERIEDLRNDAHLRTKIGKAGSSALESLSKNIQRYSKFVSIAATTVSSASTLMPSLSVKIAAFGFSAASSVASLFNSPPPTLEELKNKIIDDLHVISKLAPNVRFAVLIDDTDRLEPNESVEILRLAKAVANFPLVTYLICFDMSILSAQVREIVRVGDGADYLEKIFQQIVPIPPQEPFALRRFVRRRLVEQFPTEMTVTDLASVEIGQRQDIIFDNWVGKLIETPRDAIRLCENVKFGWPFLADKGDFLDYVWLQLIKLKCRPLYDWTRGYVTSLGAYRDGGRPNDGQPSDDASKLKAILEKLDWGKAPDRSGITSILPGLKSVLLEGTKSTVFEFSPARELATFEAQCRLGSPSHWRFYFAYEKPSYALDDSDLPKFRKLAATDRASAATFLRDMRGRKHQKNGFFLDVLLDRLEDQAESFSAAEQVGIAWSFADVMDELPRGASDQFTDSDPWRKSLRLLGSAIGPHFTQIVSEGRSINWLAIAMRDQGFALGVADRDRSAPARQWLTRTEFDSAFAAILARFRSMGLEAIFALPEPAQVLFCWDQLGDSSKELRRTIADQTKTDDGMFIRALSAMRSWVASSNRGVYHALQTEIVSYFFDVGDVLARLKKIASQDNDTELKNAATQILSVLDERKFVPTSAEQDRNISTDGLSAMRFVYPNTAANAESKITLFRESFKLLPDGQPIKIHLTMQRFYIGVENLTDKTLRNVRFVIESVTIPPRPIEIHCRAKRTNETAIDIQPKATELFFFGEGYDSSDGAGVMIRQAGEIEKLAEVVSVSPFYLGTQMAGPHPLLKNDGYAIGFSAYADDVTAINAQAVLNTKERIELRLTEGPNVSLES